MRMLPGHHEILEALKHAPMYQPVLLERDDPQEFRDAISRRNKQCKGVVDRQPVIKYISGHVLDLGCNIGYFAFAGRPDAFHNAGKFGFAGYIG